MQVQCEACQATGRQDAVRDEYGDFETCPECHGEGVLAVTSSLDEALAAMEQAEIRQEQELLACAAELRTNLDKLERVLRGEVRDPATRIRIVRNAEGLDEIEVSP